MEKPLAALEISSKQLKLIVGYELDGKVYVLYTLNKPYVHIVKEGKFIDVPELNKAIASICEIADSNVKLRINISDALVALPPYGIQVFNSDQITTIVSEDSKVSSLDVKNIYTLIRNGTYPTNSVLADIIPNAYVLEDQRTFPEPPFGETSKSLKVKSKVHTLPSFIVNNYSAVVKNSGIAVRRTFVAPFAASQLLATYPEIPSDYILVDIGSEVTTVSLIGQKELYDSRFFSWGGDNITDHIIASFNIGEEDAEKIKVMYGIDNRVMNFEAPVCTSDDGSGNEIKHYTNELNKIIKSELDIFIKEVDSALNQLFNVYDSSYKRLPMVLIGGGSRLHGLVDYILPKLESEKIIPVVPKTLGARNPSYFTLLGMILIANKYPLIQEEDQAKVGSLTRNNK